MHHRIKCVPLVSCYDGSSYLRKHHASRLLTKLFDTPILSPLTACFKLLRARTFKEATEAHERWNLCVNICTEARLIMNGSPTAKDLSRHFLSNDLLRLYYTKDAIARGVNKRKWWISAYKDAVTEFDKREVVTRSWDAARWRNIWTAIVCTQYLAREFGVLPNSFVRQYYGLDLKTKDRKEGYFLSIRYLQDLCAIVGSDLKKRRIQQAKREELERRPQKRARLV